MPSFLSNFRRKSKIDFKSDKPGSSATHDVVNGNSKSNGHATNGIVSRRKSSSTLASSATTPATSTSDSGSAPARGLKSDTPPLPTSRPSRPGINATKRYSMNGIGSTSDSQMSVNPSSILSPKVLSITENTWVNQQVLLIFGQIGEGSHKPLDGTITVNHHMGRFPPTNWPVYGSYFKALVHLEPGPNRLRLDFSSPKISSASTSFPSHYRHLTINYLPLTNNPPLQLAIILGSDSQGTFDAPPERVQREGNGIETAVRKYRMAAYLWQAFTGEQMQRAGFGRRCFQFEEAFEPGTLSEQDWSTGFQRSQAKVHIIRSNKTVAELRNIEIAQQAHRSGQGELFGIAAEAVQSHFNMQPGEKHYVACMFLDAHWDPAANTILGHAALGGGVGDLQLAIFGSHALHSYPSSLDRVPEAFSDCHPTDTTFVANDCNESGSSWEAANIGIGAHMHEVGHLFGCPHQEFGVMARDYVTLNRTFVCRDSYSTRTKTRGQQLVLQEDECQWHRLDMLRFRYHPSFRTPLDPNYQDESVQAWTVDSGQGGVIATSVSGIAWIEIFGEGDDLCHRYIEYSSETESNSERSGPKQLPRQVPLDEANLRALLPKEKQKKPFKLLIFSAGGGLHVVEDFSVLSNQKLARVRLPDGRWGYRGSKLGYSQTAGSEPQEVILESAYIQTKLLVCIRVYHAAAVDGIEFIYEDTTSQLFGKRGGNPGGSDFMLDTRRGELLLGFSLRAGLWIDGLQIQTSLGRRSEWYGNPNGGSGHKLIPPRGYTLGGISGSCGQWLDGFSLIITR